MRTRTFIVGFAALALCSSAWTPAVAGYGLCIEPRVPTAMFLNRPSKPICISGCSEWQVSEYKQEVSTYFNNLEQYATDVDRYYKKAGEYIQCMSDLD